MTLYAIVEDWDSGGSWKDHEYYDNQLIGLFESKFEAMGNLRTGVADFWREDGISVFGKYVVTYHGRCGTLYRRLVEVKTGEIHPNVFSDSILNSNI